MSIKVIVVGAAGRMGREVVKAVSGADDMALVAAVDRTHLGEPVADLVAGAPAGLVVRDDFAAAVAETRPTVCVDFSHHSVVASNAVAALDHGCSPVIGATGLTNESMETIRAACERTGLPALYAPNFAVGAVLMMRFSEVAAKWFPDVEILEMHHERKEDAPSGTALHTAELIAAARTGSPVPKPTPVVKAEGALGGRAHGVPVHSVRLPGLLAHQQVMFGLPGETLTIRHDSTDRAGFMTGVKLAIRQVHQLKGFVVGLDKLLF
jgi:4-hydroxy-tetrahydrodipicolinate reductase